MQTDQPTLPTIGDIPPAGSLKDRIAWILEKHPKARDDYKLVHFYYWLEYDGLAGALEYTHSTAQDIEDAIARFQDWYITTARPAKTLLQRTQDCQRERPHLRPSPAIQEKRRRQGRQGPIN